MASSPDSKATLPLVVGKARKSKAEFEYLRRLYRDTPKKREADRYREGVKMTMKELRGSRVAD